MATQSLTRFTDPDCWKTSRKGNLYRYWNGDPVTIFEREDGFYLWCVGSDKGPTFSDRAFETLSRAMRNVQRHLGAD